MWHCHRTSTVQSTGHCREAAQILTISAGRFFIPMDSVRPTGSRVRIASYGRRLRDGRVASAGSPRMDISHQRIVRMEGRRHRKGWSPAAIGRKRVRTLKQPPDRRHPQSLGSENSSVNSPPKTKVSTVYAQVSYAVRAQEFIGARSCTRAIHAQSFFLTEIIKDIGETLTATTRALWRAAEKCLN